MIENTRARSGLSSTLLIGLLLLLLLGFCVRWALVQGLPEMWHPPLSKLHWFELKDLRIHAELPLKEEILLTYLPPLKGRSLLTIQPSELYSRLKDKPWVAEVSIKKEYPDRLTVLVEPKKARAISFQDGAPYFLDVQGKVIERVPKGAGQYRDLPFINGEIASPKWKLESVLSVFYKLKSQLGTSAEISELQLSPYPLFKVFLSKPRVEVLFNVENWEQQASYLVTLLASPPSQIRQIHKINLLFPKKAIVTRPVSH